MVNGVTGAVRTKSAVLPLVMLLTVNAVPPVLDIVTVWVADVVPTVWLAYVSAAGDTLSAPATTPVPDAADRFIARSAGNGYSCALGA